MVEEAVVEEVVLVEEAQCQWEAFSREECQNYVQLEVKISFFGAVFIISLSC